MNLRLVFRIRIKVAIVCSAISALIASPPPLLTSEHRPDDVSHVTHRPARHMAQCQIISRCFDKSVARCTSQKRVDGVGSLCVFALLDIAQNKFGRKHL